MKHWARFVVLVISLTQALTPAHALTPEERMQQRMRLREEMHRKMLDSVLRGGDPSSTLRDMDAMMDSLMEDSLADMQQLRGLAPGPVSRALSMQWSETKEGRILFVKSADKDAKLDVEVKDQVVTIKTEFGQSTNGSQVRGQSTLSKTIPSDCDGEKVKLEAKEGGLELFFPFRGRAQEKRVPLPGKPSDIQT